MLPDSSQVVPDYPLEDGDLDSETGNAIRIPCNPTFDIPQPPMIPPTDLDRCGRPLNDFGRFETFLKKNSPPTFFFSASRPGSSTCHCKRRNARCISCITTPDTGPSSLITVTWTTRTSSVTRGSWRVAFPAPAGGKRPRWFWRCLRGH